MWPWLAIGLAGSTVVVIVVLAACLGAARGDREEASRSGDDRYTRGS